MEQLNLSFEQGISRKHRTLQRCCSAWVYRLGFNDIAIDIDASPGNLSNKLSEDSNRKFGVDDLEKVLDEYCDFEPIYYLIDKFLSKQTDLSKQQLLARADNLMSEFRGVINELQQGDQ